MKIIKGISFITSLLFTLLSTAQIESQKDSVDLELYKIEGDSVYDTSISLNEVYVFGPLKFASKEEKLRYYILRRKTLKVYPYAKMAAEKLVVLNDSLQKLNKKSKKRKYTRKVHKEIEDQFSERLKKLTRTEGQILIKLINRQTGDTAFGLVKELRNGWRAFWYNTSAKFFKISIKEEYHPESVHEDYLIEDILQRAFAKGRLKEQPTVLNYDYTSLSNKWIYKKK
ncbi:MULTISPECIES: DUF4294 domain-containing protein [unclassified Cellulophaga]|uniref:DUF4294 domain-containing protein n=1 Tax=unclassified Cellulophaga TaxID=2634405 RepID=UPI0026E3F071|nr:MULTISPECIES: DUF4294 domain-containing protein [unclassified Cellulophaga]MDO6492963.1 DUF4294 domain-containing protein [Cellulophaga sp. 2_MG-2023]MDO6496413.1 DUF4294 domain-containing protein [Cellulophaga sp. 3_MG-2023]